MCIDYGKEEGVNRKIMFTGIFNTYFYKKKRIRLGL